MIICKKVAELREIVGQWRRSGERIALVPTMGYFHRGHCALMHCAKTLADRVVVSLFVNPTQFGPNEDLAVYPRDFDGDQKKAQDAGVDMLFCPETGEMYSDDDQTTVAVPNLSKWLCGSTRPGHFQGVATIVSKLFNIVQPDSAVFGEKDFQQLTIIRRMVADLCFPVKVIGHETVREPDGLALSSRNVYLDTSHRRAALALYNALLAIRSSAAGGQTDAETLLATGKKIIAAESQVECEYVAIVDAATLQPKSEIGPECRVLGAIRVGGRVRLIDNMPLL